MDHAIELRGVTAPAADLRLVARERALDGRLDFLVVDDSGAPVEGVVVPVLRIWELFDDRMPRTDAEGRVHFEKLPRIELRVGAPRSDIAGEKGFVLAGQPRTVTPTLSRKEVTLTLERCFAVSGRVRSASVESIG